MTEQSGLGNHVHFAGQRDAVLEAMASRLPAIAMRGRHADGAQPPSFHPSLRIRKMRGYESTWEGRVTLGYVFTFHIEHDPETGETIYVFRNIGKHDIYRSP